MPQRARTHRRSARQLDPGATPLEPFGTMQSHLSTASPEPPPLLRTVPLRADEQWGGIWGRATDGARSSRRHAQNGGRMSKGRVSTHLKGLLAALLITAAATVVGWPLY